MGSGYVHKHDGARPAGSAVQEPSKILTVLTSTHGKSQSPRGGGGAAASAAAAQPLMLSEMTLFVQRDRYTLTEAQPVELFPGLTGDIARFSLGAYFAELLRLSRTRTRPTPSFVVRPQRPLPLSEGRRDVRLVGPCSSCGSCSYPLRAGPCCLRPLRKKAREPVLLLDEGALLPALQEGGGAVRKAVRRVA